MTDSKIGNSFVPRERGPQPRILLLDFDESYKTFLEDENYSVYLGSSGFSQDTLDIPIHESEVEIMLWDTSNLRENPISDTLDATRQQHQVYIEKVRRLGNYFRRIKGKCGFVGVFLGNLYPMSNSFLPEISGYSFSFGERKTSTMDLNRHEEDDVWYEFYSRFIKEENIRFSISQKKVYNISPYPARESYYFAHYFEDEDGNFFAVNYDYFAIIPQIEDNKKKDALRFLLQDVLPFFCEGDDIFPDKYYYLWANKDVYLPSKVQKLRKNEKEIIEQHQQQLEQIKNETKQAMNEAEYLSNMLIADDSDSFPDDKKLSVSVQIVLQNDLGFKVTNVDEMRLNAGKSLKEDIWVKDNDGFFALGEIKGTDKGAKASWIKLDLNAHIKEFEVLKGITGLNSILIFNHERRTEPEDRNRPFLGDSDLIEYCIRSNICLLPVYELFKLARDVKEGLVSAKEARDKIKICKGLFNY